MQTQDFHLRYVIVDDDEIDRAVVEAEAGKFSFLQKIASCSNPVEALEIIDRSNPDVIFLDIEMPGISGTDFLRKKDHLTALPVFVTSHPEFALEGFELEAFDYLIKPVSSERFAACALRLHDFFQMRVKAYAFDTEQENNFIIVKQGYDKYKIAINDILYLEAMKDYTKIVTARKSYLVLGTITSMHNKLPENKFVRVHRSYITNTDAVQAIKENKILLSNAETIPVGKTYKNILNKIF